MLDDRYTNPLRQITYSLSEFSHHFESIAYIVSAERPTGRMHFITENHTVPEIEFSVRFVFMLICHVSLTLHQQHEIHFVSMFPLSSEEDIKSYLINMLNYVKTTAKLKILYARTYLHTAFNFLNVKMSM